MSKRKKVASVTIYFSDDVLEIRDHFLKIVEATGLSQSEAAFIAFSFGFYRMLDEKLWGMPLFRDEKKFKTDVAGVIAKSRKKQALRAVSTK